MKSQKDYLLYIISVKAFFQLQACLLQTQFSNMAVQIIAPLIPFGKFLKFFPRRWKIIKFVMWCIMSHIAFNLYRICKLWYTCRYLLCLFCMKLKVFKQGIHLYSFFGLYSKLYPDQLRYLASLCFPSGAIQ